MNLETTPTALPASFNAANLPTVEVWTDGSCRPNPGGGGYAAILRNAAGAELEVTGWLSIATNNQAELMGAIVALEALPGPRHVIMNLDSEYVQGNITLRLPSWLTNGWKTSKGKPVLNRAHWERLVAAASRHVVDWRWTASHGTDGMNNRVDVLATRARETQRGEPGGAHVRRVPSAPSAPEADPQ